MPYDNVYSEKRTPGALRTVWRNFYGDTTAMIGFTAALASCCCAFWVRGLRRMASINSSPVISFTAVVVALRGGFVLHGD